MDARLGRRLAVLAGLAFVLALPGSAWAATFVNTPETLTVQAAAQISLVVPATIAYPAVVEGTGGEVSSTGLIVSYAMTSAGGDLGVALTNLTGPGGTIAVSTRSIIVTAVSGTNVTNLFPTKAAWPAASGVRRAVSAATSAVNHNVSITLYVNVPPSAVAGDYTATATWTVQ